MITLGRKLKDKEFFFKNHYKVFLQKLEHYRGALLFENIFTFTPKWRVKLSEIFTFFKSHR